jgi:hypothetical protein
VLEIGAEIHGYRIERLLGRGGMGEVYEATQLALGRRVAFKVLHTRLGQDEDFRERFRREGRLQATLEHPNVVTVYEAGQLDEDLFLALRLVEGATLKQLLVSGELDAGRALRILAPIADALDVAHRAGLVHRDVKPQNILVRDDDHPFLADFGLTRGPDQSGVTRTGEFIGTIDYISPEQVRGEPAGPASDVYALAGVLYECLTGMVPYARPSDAAVLYAHVNDEPPSGRAVRPDLPTALDAVIAAGMAKEPEDRPETATELIAQAAAAIDPDAALRASRPPRRDALAHGVRAVEGETAAGATPATVPNIGGSTRRSRTALAGGAAVAALAALAFVGGRAVGGDTPALSTTVASDAVSLRAPSTWRATGAAERPAVPGLRLRDAVGVGPQAPDGSGIMAGMTAATGPSMLPAELRERIDGGPPTPAAVDLGELEALRYRDVAVRGFDRQLTFYAAPSTAGVVTVACYAPSPDAAASDATCESVAQTLELLDADALPLTVDRPTTDALERIARQLDRERATGRRRLARARTPSDQAAAATALQRSYRDMASEIDALDGGPALDPVRRAAASAATAYRDLASGARAGDGRAYSAARDAVAASERRLTDALASLADPGATEGEAP